MGDTCMGRKGFTLMELMIVVVIVGILSAVAIPLYTGHVTRTRRTEAVSALQTIALYEEKHMAERGVYGTITQLINNVGLPDPDGDKLFEPSEYYTIAVLPGAGNLTYISHATPSGAFVDDVGSPAEPLIFAINSAGQVGRWRGGAFVANEKLWKDLRP